MAVEVNVERNAIELTYDDTEVQGDTINVTATNPETGEVSSRSDLKNDGRFTWTFPADYTGAAEFLVTGSDGGEDKGKVHLG